MASPTRRNHLQSLLQIGEHRIESVNTLALPKNRVPKCELSGLMATMALITKDFTLYYATREHAENAWDGIIYKIGPVLGPLRAAPQIVGSDVDRAKRKLTIETSKKALIEVCLQESSKWLVDAKPHLAIPGAMQAYFFAKEIYGDGSIELTPAYMTLAEANLCLGRFQQTEEFLALANWTILNTPNCSNVVKSQLHRNFGKLYSASGRFDDALRELSKDIYYSSLEHGPEHVLLAMGYYLTGTVFYTQDRIESALAMFDKSVDVWYKFLGGQQAQQQQQGIFTSQSRKKNNSNNNREEDQQHLLLVEEQQKESDGEVTTKLNEAAIREGMEMLRKIHNTRETILGAKHIATGEAKYIMGLLFLYAGDKSNAKVCFEPAHAIYQEQLGSAHPSTIDLNRLLQDVRTALEIHAFHEAGEEEEERNNNLYNDEGGEANSIEASFAEDLPVATSNSPIPSPPASRKDSSLTM